MPGDAIKWKFSGELKEIVKALDKKTLATLHKVVVEVADGSKAENEAATKKKIDADPEIGKKLAKAIEEATEMRRAPFTWTAAFVPNVLNEAGLRGHCPDTVDGKSLVLDDVFKGEDAEKWETVMKVVAFRWLGDQVTAEKAFDPPDAVCEHYPMKWEPARVNQFLTKLSLPEWGIDGKTLVKMLQEDHYSEVHKEQLSKGLKEETVLFFEDVAKLM